jgi:6-phosphogluconolactonase (cycloisomerase 2 family)
MSRMREAGAAVLAALAAGFSSSCGSPSGPVATPSPPGPSPTPSFPPPRAVAYVVDPAANALVAFEADLDTGQLRLIETRAESAPRLLAVDPGGRLLYMAGGDTAGSVRSYVRSYSIEAATGRLTARSTQTWDALMRPPLSLAASARQLYVIGGRPFTGTHGGWVAFGVDVATGLLTESPRPPQRFEPDFVVASPEPRFVYTEALDQSNSFLPTLFVSSVQADGRLEDVGTTVIEAALSTGALGLGFLFVADSDGGLASFAVDEASGRLSPRALLTSGLGPGRARLALHPGGLLAAAAAAQVQVYAVGARGELSRRDEIALPSSSGPYSLAFQPSGRYLYASGSAEGVRIFAVGADGRLTDAGRATPGGGDVVLVDFPGNRS